LAYSAGQSLVIGYDGTHYMNGTISSYNPSTGELIGDITSTVGIGSYSDWDVNLGGAQGADGSSGTSGTSGSSGSSGTSGETGSSGTSGSSGSSGTGTNITAANNIGLSITTGVTGDTIYTIYNTLLDPTLAMPSAVGGIAINTTVSQLTGKTVVDMFNDLLFPTVLPTYTIPTITLGGVSSQTLEAGSTYAPSITLSGIKNDADIYTQLRILRNSTSIFTDSTLTESSATDVAAQFGYTDPNNPNHTYTISPTPYSESYILPSGASATTTYQGDGNYNSGVAKNNNKGSLDVRALALRSVNAPQLSGSTFGSTTYTITSIFPYFWGKMSSLPTTDSIAAAISGGTANKVVTAASGTLTITFNSSSEYIWVAYQNSYTSKIKWYRTALDNGSCDGSFITAAVTKTVNSPSSYWIGITYKMQWSVYGTTQAAFEFRES
jgi:hypothetical protein